MIKYEGLIIKITSNQFSVLIKHKVVLCSQKGSVRFLNVEPLIGDRVEVTKDEYNHFQITAIKNRKNFLTRPKVANIDQLIIVMAVDKPKFNHFKIMQYLFMAKVHNIEPVIIINKRDLIKEHPEVKTWYKYYRKLGYTTILVSNIRFKWWYRLVMRGAIHSKINVLTGPSGVGKSTMINTLKGVSVTKTAEKLVKGNWGAQTTRHNELHDFDHNLIADTPGFSSWHLTEFSPQFIAEWFTETLGASACDYKNCLHQAEKKCIIKPMINNTIEQAFYKDYIKLIGDAKQHEKK